MAFALILGQAALNVAQFALLTPASPAALGGSIPSRSKTLLQRATSDLQVLTFPTAFTIRQSDERVAEVLELVGRACPTHDPIIIAGIEPVDWRRIMWYFPSAVAVQAIGGSVNYLGTRDGISPVPDAGVLLRTACPVIWLAPGDDSTRPFRPAGAVPGPRLGWTIAPGTFRVTPTAITPLEAGAPVPLH